MLEDLCLSEKKLQPVLGTVILLGEASTQHEACVGMQNQILPAQIIIQKEAQPGVKVTLNLEMCF